MSAYEHVARTDWPGAESRQRQGRPSTGEDMQKCNQVGLLWLLVQAKLCRAAKLGHAVKSLQNVRAARAWRAWEALVSLRRLQQESLWSTLQWWQMRQQAKAFRWVVLGPALLVETSLMSLKHLTQYSRR